MADYAGGLNVRLKGNTQSTLYASKTKCKVPNFMFDKFPNSFINKKKTLPSVSPDGCRYTAVSRPRQGFPANEMYQQAVPYTFLKVWTQNEYIYLRTHVSTIHHRTQLIYESPDRDAMIRRYR